MKRSRASVLLLLLVLVLCNASEGCFLFSGKTHVAIWRNISSNWLPVRVHCFSKDDDLGNHTLYGSQNFEWSFCNDVVVGSQFFCHAWWGNRNGGFTAFAAEKTRSPGWNTWAIKDDGFFYTNRRELLYLEKMCDWAA
ncbi:hypothetical protein M569_01933 [Genlisea aurea]|uniref:S-protein homolog n=1 Tax=Genlisea aurea TaxID=192259 RepID=S8D0G8_9LAMI|nr:hypothetical protein M569_01933 [Genlisea aurea]